MSALNWIPGRTTPRLRLAHAGFWTVLATGAQLALGMITSVVAARILGPLRFGELSIARSTIYTTMLLAGANLTTVASRSVAELRGTDKDRAGRVAGFLLNLALLFAGAITVLCVVFAAPLANAIGAPQIATALALGAPYILLSVLSSVYNGTLMGFEAFGAAAASLALEAALTTVLLATAAYFAGVNGAMIAIVSSAVIAIVFRQRMVAVISREHGVTIRHRGVESEFPLLRALVIPSLIFGLGGQPFAWLARVILTRSESGLVEVGVFSAAFAWGSAVLNLPAQVTRPAMPILTNLIASGDTDAFRKLLRDTLVLATVSALLIATPLMALSPWIMRAYGPRFAAGAPVLSLIAAASAVGAVSAALRSALVAAGRMWGQAIQSATWGLTLVASFYVLRAHGAIGLATAYLIAFTVSLLMQIAMTIVAFRRGLQATMTEPVVVDAAITMT